MAKAAGTDWFSPIATPTGFRLLNNAAESGINNKTFQQAVDTALQDSSFPKLDAQPGYADSGYLKNDWKAQNHGEGYLGTASRTGRPDVQRAAAELLATLGPRVSQIEEDFAHRLGWTPNRDTRVWETSPVIQQHAGAVIPSPPQPWQVRPAPGGPSLFGGEAYHASTQISRDFRAGTSVPAKATRPIAGASISPKPSRWRKAICRRARTGRWFRPDPW